MNKVEILVNDIKETAKQANFDVENIPAGSRPAHEIVKRQAVDRLSELKNEYSQIMTDSLAFIFLLPDGKVSSFLEQAKKNDVFVLNSDEVYSKMAEKIWPMIGKDGTYMPDHAAALMQEILAIGKFSGYEIDQAIDFPNREYVDSKSKLQTLIKNLVRTKYGDTYNLMYINKVIINHALDKLYIKEFLPIVIYSLTSEEINFFEKETKTKVCIDTSTIKKIDQKSFNEIIQNLEEQLNCK